MKRTLFVLITILYIPIFSQPEHLSFQLNGQKVTYTVSKFNINIPNDSLFSNTNKIIQLIEQDRVQELKFYFVDSDIGSRLDTNSLHQMWPVFKIRQFTHLINFGKFKVIREKLDNKHIVPWLYIKEGKRWKCYFPGLVTDKFKDVQRALWDDKIPLRKG